MEKLYLVFFLTTLVKKYVTKQQVILRLELEHSVYRDSRAWINRLVAQYVSKLSKGSLSYAESMAIKLSVPGTDARCTACEIRFCMCSDKAMWCHVLEFTINCTWWLYDGFVTNWFSWLVTKTNKYDMAQFLYAFISISQQGWHFFTRKNRFFLKLI